MRFELNTNIVIEVENSNIASITTVFLKSLAPLFATLVSQVLLHFRDVYAKNGELDKLLDLEEGDVWHWKSKQGYSSIKINSLFGKIALPNPVVEIRKSDGRILKKVIGRKLISVSAYRQIPDFMGQMLASLGGLMSFRNVAKSMQVFGIFRTSLDTIWRSLQISAADLVLKVCPQTQMQDQILEADGTGICTLGSGKRGSEAKVLMQRKASGGLYFCGIKVGKYGNKLDWEGLLSPIKDFFKHPIKLILVADGDQSILEVFKKMSQKNLVFFQRCLWHIPHQIKYMLWKDNASKEQRKQILVLTYNAFLLRKTVPIEELAHYISMKLLRIENLLLRCQSYGLTTTLTFLQNAKDNAFVLGRSVEDNHNTSLTERTMRTIKQRTRYAVWSDKGVENVIKIRLNHFYNDSEIGLHFRT